MKILYIHQYFKTPEEGGAIRSWYISQAMAGAGHEVHLVTSHNKNVFKKKESGGIYVHYLPVQYRSSYGFFRRIIAFFMFSWEAYVYGKKLGKPDLIYVTSTPLTVGITALLLKRYFRSPYVFEVRDLWPEAPIQMNIIRHPWIKSGSRYLEKKAYEGADAIVVLSPGIEQYIKNLLPEKPVHLCPNMSACDFFGTNPENGIKIREKYSLQDKFVIGYFGAVGRSNALGYFLELARIAGEESRNMAFFIIGEGPEKDELMKRSETMKLKDLYFIGHLNKEDLREFLYAIDAAYISFVNLPVFQLNSPNKFFDALASGKMIISNTDGWIRDLIETYGCGFYYDPEDTGSFFKKLDPVIQDPEKLSNMKRNARILAESRFDSKKLIEGLFSCLNI